MRSWPLPLVCVIPLSVAACGAAPPPPPEGPQGASASEPAAAAPSAPDAPPAATGKMTAGASQAAGHNILWNGAFAGEGLRPWNVAFDSAHIGRGAIAEGELCVNVDQAGEHTYDAVVRQRPLALAKGHSYQLR